MEDEQFGLQLKRVHDMFKGAPGPHYVLIPEAERARVASLDLPVEILPYSDHGQPLLNALAELAEAANVAAAPPPPSYSDKPAAIAPESDGETSAAPVFSVPFLPKGSEVVGREAALLAVRKQLVEGRPTHIGQTAAFRGLGGLGKTQLAVEYAYRYQDEYRGGVIWLTADQDIDAQLTELAPKAGWIAAESEHKYKLDVAMQRLQTHSGLLVFDNVESREVIEPYLPPRETGAHILLTSRTEQQGFIPVPLDLLDMQQSLELLTREADRYPESEADQEAIREIAGRLGGLPLALELAGAFIRHREIGWGLYRDRLNKNLRAALSGKFLESLTEHETDLYSTLQIDEEVFEDEPLLKPVLDVLAWSGPAPMGVSLLSAMLALEDPTELTDALGLGGALRLLQNSPGSNSYAIHRLVSEVWRVGHPIGDRREWVESCCARLGDWFQDRKENFLDLPFFEAEIDHIRAWREHAATIASNSRVRLLWLQAYPPYHRGQYREACRGVEEALSEFREQATAEAPELSGHLLNDLGVTYSGLGEHRKALGYHEHAHAVWQELFGERHPDTARSLNNIGTIYSKLGEHRKALEYKERAHAIWQELFGERHPDTATSLNNIGVTYSDLGEHRKALEYKERAHAILQELFGERHPDTARSLNNIGTTYRDLGEHRKALEYKERAHAIWQELFDERHPDTATSLNNIGVTYSELGEHRKALEYKERAHAIWQELFGERHPSTATSLNNIGATYSDLGEHRKALGYKERAHAIRQELFGERHPSTATSLNNIGATYSDLGELRKALEYQERALAVRQQVLGDTHPDTVAVSLSLAATLHRSKKDDEAFIILDGVFRKLERSHPSYAVVQQQLQVLGSKTVRPGFRQPSVSKQSQSPKQKRKRKR